MQINTTSSTFRPRELRRAFFSLVVRRFSNFLGSTPTPGTYWMSWQRLPNFFLARV